MTSALAGSCPNGAQIAPGFNLTTIALDTGLAGLGAVLGITETVPWLFADGVIGTIATGALCALNLSDPGDFDINMLSTPSITGGVPAPSATPGSIERWIWDKTAYYFFQQGCVCIGTGQAPPPPVVITNPPGTDTRPTTPDGQDQLTRIENNQAVSTNGLLNLYGGLQLGLTDARDAAFRGRPSVVSTAGVPTWSMSGEGQVYLAGYDQSGGGSTQDPFGVVVHLTQIPATVARRGSTYQRLYGVGSVEWNVEVQAGYPHTIAKRDALHYERQYISAPTDVQAWSLRWRLMPGVLATGYQIARAPDDAIYAPLQAYPGAYQEFSRWQAPPGWQDHPFYPLPASRSYSLPPAAPP